MLNKDSWPPRSTASNQHCIVRRFPLARPVFWGPGQFTKWPDVYNEPTGWKVNEKLSIPRVARFFFGKATAVNVNRHIYLGRVNYAVVRIRMADIPFFDMPIREYLWFSDFEQDGSEIRSDYAANKSTLDLLNGVMLTDGHGAASDFTNDRPDIALAFFNQDYIGGSRTSYTNPSESPPHNIYSLVNFLPNAGTTLFAPNRILDYDVSGYPIDASTAVPNTPESYYTFASDDTTGKSDYNSFRLMRTYHIFLWNTIIGSTQTNRLGVVRNSLRWNQPVESFSPTIGPDYYQTLTVSGLTLRP